MCGTYLYFVSCFFFQVLLTRVVIYNYILTIVAAALSCKSTIKYIYDEDFTLFIVICYPPQTKAFLLINKFNVKNIY